MIWKESSKKTTPTVPPLPSLKMANRYSCTFLVTISSSVLQRTLNEIFVGCKISLTRYQNGLALQIPLTFREKLCHLLHTNKFQIAIVTLVVIDCIIVISELLIDLKILELDEESVAPEVGLELFRSLSCSLSSIRLCVCTLCLHFDFALSCANRTRFFSHFRCCITSVLEF